MRWSQWIVLSINFMEEEKTLPLEHAIGLTAAFNLNWGSIPNICRFEMGAIGGTLVLSSNSGNIATEHCWGYAENYATDNQENPFQHYHVRLEGNETSREWCIEHQNWQKTGNKLTPIQGRIDVNNFARLVNDGLVPNAVNVRGYYKVELYHLAITRLDLSPLYELGHTISANQHLLLKALLRPALHQKLGGQILNISSITSKPLAHLDINNTPNIEPIVTALLGEEDHSLVKLLEKANLSYDCLRGICFRNADMPGENFTNYELNGCNFFDINLRQATFNNTHLDHANLQHTDMRGASFQGETSLQKANLREANMQAVKFPNTIKFQGANFSDANLSEAELKDNKNLQGCQFIDSKLIGAKLCGADLSGIDFSRADLSGADLTGAILVGANLTDARLNVETRLKDADIRDADFSYVSLYGIDLSVCLNHEEAKLENAYRPTFKVTSQHPDLQAFDEKVQHLTEELAGLLKNYDAIKRHFGQ